MRSASTSRRHDGVFGGPGAQRLLAAGAKRHARVRDRSLAARGGREGGEQGEGDRGPGPGPGSVPGPRRRSLIETPQTEIRGSGFLELIH